MPWKGSNVDYVWRKRFKHEVVVGGVRNNLIEDFISTYRCTLDHDESSFVVGGRRIPLDESSEGRSGRVIALETALIPAGHEAVIKSSLTNRAPHREKKFLGYPHARPPIYGATRNCVG